MKRTAFWPQNDSMQSMPSLQRRWFSPQRRRPTPVSLQAARQAAATFLHIDEGSLHEMLLQWNILYFFAIENGGFVLTSADSRVQPVLGYSLNEKLPRPDGNVNEAFEYCLESYDAQIQAAVAGETLGEHPQ